MFVMRIRHNAKINGANRQLRASRGRGGGGGWRVGGKVKGKYQHSLLFFE